MAKNSESKTKTDMMPKDSDLSPKNINWQSMKKKWESTVVARDKISEFTGGTISPKYIANLDSQNKGPEGRIRIGRKIAYPVDLLIIWLERKTEVL